MDFSSKLFLTHLLLEICDLLANARLLFQPYDAQGNPLSDRIFSFGRAWPAEGQQPDEKEDGLLMVNDPQNTSFLNESEQQQNFPKI